MEIIAANLAGLRSRISEMELRYDRIPGTVGLLAVTKTRTANEILAAIECGQREFGESYLQEAMEKINLIRDPGITWHFIGPVQSNKTRAIAENFSWVHSVDRIKIARRLNEMRPAGQPPLNICIQLNISGEATKTGIHPSGLREFAAAVREMEHLRLRGLMTMPELFDNFERQRRPFQELHDYFLMLNDDDCQLDTLSMGTTYDMEAAIAEGSTIVRIGTAIFGPRS